MKFMASTSINLDDKCAKPHSRFDEDLRYADVKADSKLYNCFGYGFGPPPSRSYQLGFFVASEEAVLFLFIDMAFNFNFQGIF